MNLLLLAATCLITSVAGAPFDVKSAKQVPDDLDNSEVTGNASSLFGWQLAASQPNPHLLEMICDNINGTFGLSEYRWANIGLEPEVVKNVVCVAYRTGAPKLATTLDHVRATYTDIFITQFTEGLELESVERRDWYCKHLDYSIISTHLGLDSNRIASDVCRNKTGPWQFPGFNGSVTESDLDAYVYRRTSAIFAIQYVMTAASLDQRQHMCDWYKPDTMLKGGIMPAVVHDALCRPKQEPLMDIEDAEILIDDKETDLFIGQLALAVDFNDDDAAVEYRRKS